MALYQNNIANAYFDSGQNSEALIHYSVALGLYQELLNEYGIAMVSYTIGNVHQIEEKYTQAIDNFLKSIQIAENNSYSNILAQNYFALFSVYKKIGNNKLALEYYKKYYEMQSPVSRRNNQIAQFIEKHIVDAEQLDMLKMKMRQKESVYELENIKYQKELELLEERERLLEFTKISFGVFLGGLLVLFILLLLRFRTRRKYYAELSIKNAEILQQQEEISVQRENLEMLNYQLEQLSIVASQTANAVVILNADASVEWVNNSFVSLYEKKPENFFDFINSDAEQQHISGCINSTQSVLYETQRIQNGSQVWVQCMLTPIIDNGVLTKIILIESDINDLKQQEIEIISQR
ncbi:MAG: tetratricopeptide repeat protein, partial [Bacteroidota bacterium]